MDWAERFPQLQVAGSIPAGLGSGSNCDSNPVERRRSFVEGLS